MSESQEALIGDCPLPVKKMSRRNFIDWVIRGGLLTTLAGMLFPALAYLWPVMKRGPSVGMEEIGRIDDIPLWGAKKVVIDGSALLIIRTPTAVKAFSAICTHLGCIVDWNVQKREIACPCHAGFFDTDGRVISGPPPRPLPSHSVNVVAGKILVQL